MWLPFLSNFGRKGKKTRNFRKKKTTLKYVHIEAMDGKAPINLEEFVTELSRSDYFGFNDQEVSRLRRKDLVPLARYLKIEFKSADLKSTLYQSVVNALYDQDLVSEQAIESLDTGLEMSRRSMPLDTVEVIEARGRLEIEMRKAELEAEAERHRVEAKMESETERHRAESNLEKARAEAETYRVKTLADAEARAKVAEALLKEAQAKVIEQGQRMSVLSAGGMGDTTWFDASRHVRLVPRFPRQGY